MPTLHIPRPGETAAQCRERIVRRRKLGAFVLLVGSVGIILLLSYTVFFPMTHFDVTGETRYTKTVLEAAAAVPERTQLLNLETDRVMQNLLRELPYLESAKVQRKLPNTLSVTVQDAKTVLATKVEDGCLILSGKGKVLELTNKKPEGTVSFVMEEPFSAPIGDNIVFHEDNDKNVWTQQVFDAFVAAYEGCAYKSEITALDMKNPYCPTMSYQNRITLYLGSRDSFARQLEFASITINTLDKEDAAKKSKPSKGTLYLNIDEQSFFRRAE
ncbi:MAG: FtsQ-type POTRA domain-containing protein [Oscillospiraceae bacterium]|nr:FtsQ-type POTRA domain-containing protein [Oscillospiraceae bacterium]